MPPAAPASNRSLVRNAVVLVKGVPVNTASPESTSSFVSSSSLRRSCTIRYLPIPPHVAAFYDFETFERLVSAARDRVTLLILLLGGEAGLRAGEFRALEWRDVDFKAGRLSVQRADWKGHVTDPKGFRPRHPLTKRLAETLHADRHLFGSLVLCRDDGSAIPHISVVGRVHRAARRANVEAQGVHILRHAFCSHLAMHGAPARAIQELAGHANVATTQRYIPQSGGHRGRDSTGRWTSAWRYGGDGDGAAVERVDPV